jgi:hypothetical protein
MPVSGSIRSAGPETLERVSGARTAEPDADLSGDRARAKRSSIRPAP